ncbi:hypothetical protein [Pseudomonas sp. Gutcm_11s]|uniref:hypothetical protein n=1 Tax=Pseudomonas sp. Gutcm_11s TaxID=3026088 RepID=UPI00235E37FB|nr:hypothetical protein [Pseudomonas sp. Gutcm_11s]MDD0842113.1 hypothetical protein [Pseudomonas sp. Gutcm_11s]
MSKQKWKEVNLRCRNAGITMHLPLGDDGAVPPQLRPFESLDDLCDLWDFHRQKLIDDKPIGSVASESMQTLLDQLMYHPGGEKLLTAMRLKQKINECEVEQVITDAEAVSLDAEAIAELDPYETEARTQRRRNERINKFKKDQLAKDDRRLTLLVDTDLQG